jgi:hypothetical protein
MERIDEERYHEWGAFVIDSVGEIETRRAYQDMMAVFGCVSSLIYWLLAFSNVVSPGIIKCHNLHFGNPLFLRYFTL